ncbi:MAG: ABC transporter ATP-binding protein [Micromonosporaceae bacterium]|nr:ABC transporter ATP-binding protein [Micromonosporaceae bacterium]
MQNLTVRYGAFTAVCGVSFEIPPGSVLGLVGESGSGKSSVARAIVGLTPSRGAIRLGDTDLSAGPVGRTRQVRRRVQLVFQDPRGSLDPRLHVGDSIAEGMRGGRRSARVAELLELVSLDPRVAELRPHLLSGGQRQRVAIARALAAEPAVLIADEVTASLDVSVQAVVLNLLRRLQRDLGLTMLFISHNLAVVRYVSDELAVMFHGRIVEQGPAEEVIGAPEHPYTRSLLAAIPQVGERRLLSDDAVEASVTGDPAPPPGCDYRLRCPVGPAVRPGMEICETSDPAGGKDDRLHLAACHLAEPRAPT